VFISHAAHAGLLFTVATLDRARGHRGVTAFLVDRARTEGVAIRELPMRTLRRDNLAEVVFTDAFVPDDCVLGAPGQGFPILGSALDMGRYSVAARCVGQAQRCIDLALPYARERKAFGRAIADFQLVQQKLTEMICRTEQARLLVYRLGRMKDAGVGRTSLEASLAKLCASRAAVQNALDGIQIFGAYGLSR
jgi:butyryl-CoA dehydrogenase